MAVFVDKIASNFRKVLPSPFSIALVLTGVIALIASVWVKPSSVSIPTYIGQIAKWWEQGLWNTKLLVFAFQMMLMLVLGHVLALSKPVAKLIDWTTTRFCTSTATAAFVVTLLTVIVSLFNWGMGLIFGAIFARKVAEKFTETSQPLNYPLIGACGYSGLLVWHGGLSGSSLIMAAEPGHLRGIMSESFPAEKIALLPEALPISETAGSTLNILVIFLLIVCLPTCMYLLGKRSEVSVPSVRPKNSQLKEEKGVSGAEKLDYSKWVGFVVGILFISVASISVFEESTGFLSFLTPNWINLSLFGFGLTFHRQIVRFLWAVDEAIVGASGILIQFPLYFGIMGIMEGSGLVEWLSEGLLSLGNSSTLPLITFCSAGIVNIFVPSGGGQWVVQGPIIINAALESGVPLQKMILALAYGDQLTNMLQPFWALPLLGITGLRAKDILPYTLILMMVGMVIFVLALSL